ncbi:MAG TPA: hypothetical protein VM734_25475 [Kofleriaceae bacterium]|jgi:hypothetical protein|nr:hypothetical protein [Kofleriaceae bacterium]
MVSSLPNDPQKRAEQMESSLARPEPETRKRRSKRSRTLETAAATFAALIGASYSSENSVLFGTSTAVDEGLLIDPDYLARSGRSAEGEDSEDSDETPPAYDATQLVPWVQLAPAPAP